MSLKLFVDREAGKVVYAEANKAFVDFLIYVLSLPVARVTKHLNADAAAACSLRILHKSVVNLSDDYIHPTKSRGSLFKEENESLLLSPNMPFLLPGDFFTSDKTYICDGSNKYNPHRGTTYIADDLMTGCPRCGGSIGTALGRRMYYKVNGVGSGFVKEAVTYMVMDDLEVKPQSTVNAINILKLFEIKDITSLDVEDVTFGPDEALKLVNAALSSTSVLTTVFLSPKET